MFDAEFADSLPDDPYEAGSQLCAEFEKFYNRLGGDRTAILHRYEQFNDALAMLQAIVEVNSITLKIPELSYDKFSAIQEIKKIFLEARKKFDSISRGHSVDEFRILFGRKYESVFLYDFSEGDVKRIQTLINELRESISKAEDLEDSHKQRLLQRLEKLQAELHKKMSDLDRFWGLIGDGGIVLAKLGEDAKPIVDRIREIAEIVWNVQTRAIKLSSNLPFLLLGKKEE